MTKVTQYSKDIEDHLALIKDRNNELKKSFPITLQNHDFPIPEIL